MATSFIKYESFETTIEKAKELRPVVERLITLGKNDTLAARRQAYSYLMDKAIVHKLFADVGQRCATRNGGYTRIIRTRYRNGDAAQMAVIQLVDRAEVSEGASDDSSAVEKKADSKVKASKKAPAKKASAEKKTSTKKAPAKKAKSA